MTQAYIFDLDGTLIDAEILWVEATRNMLADHGIALTPEEAIALGYGRAWHDMYRDIMARRPGWNISAAALNDLLKPYFVRLREKRDIRIPSSIHLLRSLAAEHPVCIVSGSPRREVAEGIELMGVGECLRFFMGSEDYSPGKPDPACYFLAAQKLGVPPAQCTVFEDSAAGVLAAKRAGMVCVALVRPGMPPQDVSPADLVVKDLAEFEPRRRQP